MAETVRTAIAAFDDPDALEVTVTDLEEHGFDHAEISLMADEETVQKKLGHRYQRVDEVEDDDTVPHRAFVHKGAYAEAESGLIAGLFYVGAVAAAGTVVASGGTLAAILGASLFTGGASAAIGGVLARWLEDRHARNLQAQIDRGGLLLWITVRDEAHEKKALEVLRANGGHDIHVHDFPITPSHDGG